MIRMALFLVAALALAGRRPGRKARRRRATTRATPSTASMTVICGSTGAPARYRSAPAARLGGRARWFRTNAAALEAEIARLQGENVTLKKELIARNLPLPGAVKPEPPAAKPEEPRVQLPERCRTQQGHDLHGEGLASPGRDDRDAAKGHSEQDLMPAVRSTRWPWPLAVFHRQRRARNHGDRDARGRDRRPGLHRDHARGAHVRRPGRGQGRRRCSSSSGILRRPSSSRRMPIPTCARIFATALDRLAPADAGWVHDVEGPDDMPAHVKTMLTGVSLHVPVIERRAWSRHLAGHLYCRASRAAAPARNRAAIHRQPALTADSRHLETRLRAPEARAGA